MSMGESLWGQTLTEDFQQVIYLNGSSCAVGHLEIYGYPSNHAQNTSMLKWVIHEWTLFGFD